jgi:hypothetical protein
MPSTKRAKFSKSKAKSAFGNTVPLSRNMPNNAADDVLSASGVKDDTEQKHYFFIKTL